MRTVAEQKRTSHHHALHLIPPPICLVTRSTAGRYHSGGGGANAYTGRPQKHSCGDVRMSARNCGNGYCINCGCEYKKRNSTRCVECQTVHSSELKNGYKRKYKQTPKYKSTTANSGRRQNTRSSGANTCKRQNIRRANANTIVKSGRRPHIRSTSANAGRRLHIRSTSANAHRIKKYREYKRKLGQTPEYKERRRKYKHEKAQAENFMTALAAAGTINLTAERLTK